MAKKSYVCIGIKRRFRHRETKASHDLELSRCICARVHNRHAARSSLMIFIKLFYNCELDNYTGVVNTAV